MKEQKSTKINKSQQTSTNPTSVESVGFKERNKKNKSVGRRGFVVEGSRSGTPFTHNAIQTGRNEKCHCGSGIKFKKCHLEQQVIQKV